MTKITSVGGRYKYSGENWSSYRGIQNCNVRSLTVTRRGQKEYRLKETDPVVIVTFRRHYCLSGLSKAQLQRCGRPQFMRVRNDPMALDEIQRKTSEAVDYG